MTTLRTATKDPSAFPLLRRTELGKHLTEAQLVELERTCRALSRRSGATLFRQGDTADTLFILLEGSVELRARPPGRRVYRTVEFVGPRCSLGEEALFGQSRYLTGARTLEPSRLLSLSSAAFDRMSQTHPDLAASVLRSSGACLIQTIRRSAILTQSPADVGLRMLLIELATDQSSRPNDSGPVPLRITHAQLAGVLHLSRETVSRMLRQLADEGTVELGRGVILVRPS
jgi:CRP-like cAMP-binding protein